MTKINDGGPAFPTTKPLDAWGDPNGGMTLRDWFAGQALMGEMNVNPHLPGDPASPSVWPPIEELIARRARFAYLVADAMIAARGADFAPRPDDVGQNDA